MTTPPPPRRRTVPAPTVTPAASIRMALERPATVEDALKAEVERMALADDLDGILDLLGVILKAKDVIDHMLHVVQEAGVNVVPSTREKFPIPGGGTFRVTQASAKKKVDHPKVIAAVADAIAETLDVTMVSADGVVLEDAKPVVRSIVDTIAQTCGATVPSFTGWRTGALKTLGIDLTRFTEWEDAPLKAKIESRDGG